VSRVIGESTVAAGTAERSLPGQQAPQGLLVALALGTVYVVWGSTYLAIRVMVRTVPPLVGAGGRFFVAGLALVVVLRLRRGQGSLRMRPRELAGAGVVGTLLVFGGNGLVTIAERHVPSSLAALLIASEPLWVVALRPLLAERTSRTSVIAIAVGFAGVGLLLLPGARPGGVSVAAMLLVLLAALSWASGSVGSRRLATPPDAFLSTAMQMVVGGGLMLVSGVISGEAGRLHASSFTLDAIAALAFLVIFGSLGAFTAYVWLLQNVPIGKVSTYAYVNPMVAVLLGWLILSEPISATTIAAAALIVASVAITVREESRRAAVRPALASDSEGIGGTPAEPAPVRSG